MHLKARQMLGTAKKGLRKAAREYPKAMEASRQFLKGLGKPLGNVKISAVSQ
jgi:hypothetical protein